MQIQHLDEGILDKLGLLGLGREPVPPDTGKRWLLGFPPPSSMKRGWN